MEEFRVVGANIELGVAARTGAPAVLFLHGLAGHRGEWTPVIDWLDPRVGAICPDLRAHGSSRRAERPSVDRKSHVADCIAIIEQLARRPVVVVGQSMGGIVATLLACEEPDLVTHLVLIETGMDAVDDAALDDLRLLLDAWPDVFHDRAQAAGFFGVGAPSTSAWIDGLEETEAGLVKGFDPDHMVETMRSLGSDHRWREWESLRIPTTLIRASTSVITDDDVKRMLATRPTTQLSVVENSGHDVHLDQPAQVAAILSGVLSNT